MLSAPSVEHPSPGPAPPAPSVCPSLTHVHASLSCRSIFWPHTRSRTTCPNDHPLRVCRGWLMACNPVGLGWAHAGSSPAPPRAGRVSSGETLNLRPRCPSAVLVRWGRWHASHRGLRRVSRVAYSARPALTRLSLPTADPCLPPAPEPFSEVGSRPFSTPAAPDSQHRAPGAEPLRGLLGAGQGGRGRHPGPELWGCARPPRAGHGALTPVRRCRECGGKARWGSAASPAPACLMWKRNLEQ